MNSTKEDMVTRFLAYDFATEIREWLVERVIREEGALVTLKALRADYEAWIDRHSVYLGFPLSPYHWSMALAAVIPPTEGSTDMPNASFADYRLRTETDQSEGQDGLVTAVASGDGQRALRELLDALDSLPEKKLIAGAFCTLERERHAKLDNPEEEEGDAWAADEYGAGVCVLGSYAWYKALKPDMEQGDAFALLPTLPYEEYDAYDSVMEGVRAGMPERLGWELTWINDEWRHVDTDEQRWEQVRAWVQERIVQAVPA